MHLINRIAGPLGVLNGVTAGILNHFIPRRTDSLELIAAALTPVLFPVVAYAVLRLHRDVLKTDVKVSPYDPDANPLSWFDPNPTNFFGTFAIVITGFSVGLLFVSFLDWPYNLAYSAWLGLTALSLWLTIRTLPKLFETSTTTVQATERRIAREQRAT